MKDWKVGDVAVVKRGAANDPDLNDYLGKVVKIERLEKEKHMPISTECGISLYIDELRLLTKLELALR